MIRRRLPATSGELRGRLRPPRRADLRAGLIALAIGIGLVDGCPLPPEPYVLPWQRPMVDAIRPAQRAVLTPVAWISRGLRFSQRWALMQVGPRDRFRFTVDGRTSRTAPWQVLYRANDPDHAAFADQLAFHRVAGVTNPTDRLMRQYPAFTGWFSARVLAARPTLQAVRLSFEQIVIEDGTLRGTGTMVFPMVRERGGR